MKSPLLILEKALQGTPERHHFTRDTSQPRFLSRGVNSFSPFPGERGLCCSPRPHTLPLPLCPSAEPGHRTLQAPPISGGAGGGRGEARGAGEGLEESQEEEEEGKEEDGSD